MSKILLAIRDSRVLDTQNTRNNITFTALDDRRYLIIVLRTCFPYRYVHDSKTANEHKATRIQTSVSF